MDEMTNNGVNSMNDDVNAEKAADARKSVFEILEDDIMSSDYKTSTKNKMLSRLVKARDTEVNIMLVGATGSGKSSTVNALFDMEVAQVGVGVDPETEDITSYTLENLTIWDTPGLGDGVKRDKKFNKMITKKLSELDEDGNPVVDLVLVVLDASSKDLGTSYDLINNVIIPCLDDDAESRILVGLNQADVAMKGKHWDSDNNEPDEVLLDFLKKKADSVQERIYEATGLSIKPVFYCAGYTDEDGEQCMPYNLTKLLYYIISSVKKEKRLIFADNLNQDEDMWIHDDEEEDYSYGVESGLFESVGYYVGEFAEVCGDIGAGILGIPGRIVGNVIGGVYGAVYGVIDSVVS